MNLKYTYDFEGDNSFMCDGISIAGGVTLMGLSTDTAAPTFNTQLTHCQENKGTVCLRALWFN